MVSIVATKQEQSEQSRERLVEAATALFAARGYRDTSVQAIGEAAGISRGSIFWHFGSKEGLLAEVVARAFERWERETLVPHVGEARGIKAMRRALESHRRFLTGDTGTLRLFYVLMFEALGPRAELAAKFAHLHRDLRAMSRGWIAEGIERGDIRPELDPDTTVTVIAGALGGLAYQYLLDPEGFDLDRAYADLERMLARGLAPAPR
jgi:TetR/AcrR family acrAB operon transcriptional repressor